MDDAELKRLAEAATPDGYKGAICPEHGRVERVDEDGCCTGCGCVAVGRGVDEILGEMATLLRERDEARESLAEELGCVVGELLF